MAITVIVELQAVSGRRGELGRLIRNIVAAEGQRTHGFLGSTQYEVVDDPDVLVEIAEWESAEARAAHMAAAAARGTYAPLLELLAAPFRARIIRELPSSAPGTSPRPEVPPPPRPAGRPERPRRQASGSLGADLLPLSQDPVPPALLPSETTGGHHGGDR